MKYIIVLLISLNFDALNGQKNDNVWIIGGNSVNIFTVGLQWGTMIADFGNEPVEFKYDSKITLDMAGTDACISDQNGQLLMYSNGMHVHNALHKNIKGLDTISYSNYWENFNAKNYFPDGSNWPTGFPGRQWVLMLPDPGSNNYLILHPSRELLPSGFGTRTIGFLTTKVAIDFAHPEGLVIYKDSLMSSGLFQGGINAVRHANGRDWWVVHSSEFNKAFYIYLLDPSGIHLTHTFTGTTKVPKEYSLIVGYFSPNGEKYVTSETVGIQFDTTYLTIYDFDRCSGSMQRKEFKKINKSLILYGALAFSPDGHYLYVTNGQHMRQYDMTANLILASEQIIATYNGTVFKYFPDDFGVELIFSTMVSGPDGRIYCIPPGNTRSIHTVEYPEEAGEAATMRQNSIQLPCKNFNSLPNFPNYRTGPLDGSPCDTLGLDNNPISKYRYEPDSIDYLRLRFTDLSYFRPEIWSWDFGDGSPKVSLRSPYHTFTQKGSYHVCLSVSNENSSHTTCRDLTIGFSASDDTDISTIADITLFPNPVEDILLVTIGEYIPEHGEIRIYDLSGQLVHKQRAYYGHNNVDMSGLSPGVYMLRISDGSKVIREEKIAKISR